MHLIAEGRVRRALTFQLCSTLTDSAQTDQGCYAAANRALGSDYP